MASEPYVEIFIDTLSFLSLEDASSNLHVELVRRDEGTATDAEALESAMRATVKRYWKNGVTLDLDSCRLKVNAYVPQTKAGAVDPTAKFMEDVAELQDCKVVSVSGRGDLVRARDEALSNIYAPISKNLFLSKPASWKTDSVLSPPKWKTEKHIYKDSAYYTLDPRGILPSKKMQPAGLVEMPFQAPSTFPRLLIKNTEYRDGPIYPQFGDFRIDKMIRERD
ncbi:hypothetical protein J4E81_005436 [Alternaria sp. BMP 2799]|nr:hypothetical protein J4E81_005436 [Alternaria sp. BMP 2799]